MSRRTLFLGSIVVAAAAAIAWLSTPSAVAQLGGGGFGGGGLGGGGFGGGFAPQSHAGEQIIQGGGPMESGVPSFFILTAPDKTRVWGCTTAKGEWKEAPLDDKVETGIVPIVGVKVAAIAEGRKVHGFSSLKGEWSTLELPEGANPQPVVGTDYVQVRTATSVSIFSAQTGNWTTVKFTEK